VPTFDEPSSELESRVVDTLFLIVLFEMTVGADDEYTHGTPR
jgi:hypothetical protein